MFLYIEVLLKVEKKEEFRVIRLRNRRKGMSIRWKEGDGERQVVPMSFT